MLALFVCLLLTGLLGDVIIRKPYKPSKCKQRHDGYLPPLPCADRYADNKRQNAEADYIAKRVELDAKTLFLIRAVLLRPCNDTIEHIAEAGEHKAYDSGDYLALNGKAHADNG